MERKYQIILLIVGLALLVAGFSLGAYQKSDEAGLADSRLQELAPVAGAPSPVISAGDELVPAYVPEVESAAEIKPIPAGAKPAGTPGVNAVMPTKPADVTIDAETGKATKIIKVIVGSSFEPARLYLNKDDDVKISFSNQQNQDLELSSSDLKRVPNVNVAAGGENTIDYDTSLSGDAVLVCLTCTPPMPLIIRVLSAPRALNN